MLAGLAASLRSELAGSRAALAQAVQELAAARERRSLRKKSGRKPGGQDGHEGSTLAQARADRKVRHEPGCCSNCGAGLAGRPVTGWSAARSSTCPRSRSR